MQRRREARRECPLRSGLAGVHAGMMHGEKAASGAGRRASDQRGADERERTADERERKLGEREREAGLDAKTLDERTLEAIDRARYLLALSAERLNGQEARVERGRAARAREQAQIDRAPAEGARGLAASERDPTVAIGGSGALRRQAQAAIENFTLTKITSPASMRS